MLLLLASAFVISAKGNEEGHAPAGPRDGIDTYFWNSVTNEVTWEVRARTSIIQAQLPATGQQMSCCFPRKQTGRGNWGHSCHFIRIAFVFYKLWRFIRVPFAANCRTRVCSRRSRTRRPAVSTGLTPRPRTPLGMCVTHSAESPVPSPETAAPESQSAHLCSARMMAAAGSAPSTRRPSASAPCAALNSCSRFLGCLERTG